MMFKLKLELIFLTFSSETSCVHIRVELDSESVIAQEHIDTAVKLGVHLSNLSDPVEAKKYRDFVNTRLLVHKHVKISVDQWILETTRPQKHVKFLEQYIS